MEEIVNIYKRLSYFFGLLLVFIIAGGSLIYTVPKGNIELWVNQYANPFFDNFFFYATSLGNGWFYVVVIIFLLIIKRRYFFMSMIAGIGCIFTTTVMKFLIYTKEPRPAAFFEDTLRLHFVKGAPMLYYGSFPSGHTLSAFSVFFLLSFILKRKSLQVVFFFIALTVGFSRIYLLAHFKEDVYAGAIIGSVISFIVIYIFERFSPSKDKIQTKIIKLKHPNEQA